MKRKRVCKVGTFLCVLFLLLGVLAKFLQVNNLYDQIRVKGFYLEPENSIDVVFLGASETYNAFSPGLAWEQYGFTSYMYAVSGSPVSLLKNQIAEVKKSQDPKLFVIEINGALYAKDEYQTRESALRSYIDNIPWSENKVELIENVVPEEERDSYYVSFLKYHSNWKRIGSCARNFWIERGMEKNGSSFLKGQKTRTKRCFPEDIADKKKNIPLKDALKDVQGDHSQKELSDKAEYYLRDLLEFCKEQGMDNVLFVRMPHQVQSKNYAAFQRANAAEKIIGEYGFPFVNLEYEKDAIGLDPYRDFYDKDHLNIYGSEKFTRYFGEYLVGRYGELDKAEHDAATRKRWDKTGRMAEKFVEKAKSLMEEGQVVELSEEWCLSEKTAF